MHAILSSVLTDNHHTSKLGLTAGHRTIKLTATAPFWNRERRPFLFTGAGHLQRHASRNHLNDAADVSRWLRAPPIF